MKVTFDKLPKDWVGFSGKNYTARAVDQTGKWEFVQMLQSHQNLPKFIETAEQALKAHCSEVVFHNSWTKTREEIMQ
jgi:hypothetical protein